MPAYTDKDREIMISMHAKGCSWASIGMAIGGRSAETVQRAAKRMRKNGQWPADLVGPREKPDGSAGRPRNRRRTRPVSPRFSVAVDAALREVSRKAKKRLGLVLTAAVKRALAKEAGEAVDDKPLGLKPRKTPVVLDDEAKTETMSVAVDEESFEALLALYEEGTAPNTVIAEVAVQLLCDLGYEIKDAV